MNPGDGLMIMLPLKEAKIGSAALLHSQAMIARPLCGPGRELYHTALQVLYRGPAQMWSVGTVHCKKSLSFFPSPGGISLTKLSLAGNNL